jgi:hypothetical protein
MILEGHSDFTKQIQTTLTPSINLAFEYGHLDLLLAIIAWVLPRIIFCIFSAALNKFVATERHLVQKHLHRPHFI